MSAQPLSAIPLFSGFGSRLQRALKSAGYECDTQTCRAMQRQVGLAATTAFRLMGEQSPPDRAISDDIADWLNVDREWLHSGRAPTKRFANPGLQREAEHVAEALAKRVLAAPPATRELINAVLDASQDGRLAPPAAHFLRGFMNTING